MFNKKKLGLAALAALAAVFVARRAWILSHYGLSPLAGNGKLETVAPMRWNTHLVRWVPDQNGDRFPDLLLFLSEPSFGLWNWFRPSGHRNALAILSGKSGSCLDSGVLEVGWEDPVTLLSYGVSLSPLGAGNWKRQSRTLSRIAWSEIHLGPPDNPNSTQIPARWTDGPGQEPVYLIWSDSALHVTGCFSKLVYSSFDAPSEHDLSLAARTLVYLPDSVCAPMPDRCFAAVVLSHAQSRSKWVLRMNSRTETNLDRSLILEPPSDLEGFFPRTIVGAFDVNRDGVRDWLIRNDGLEGRQVVWFDGRSGEGTLVNDAGWTTSSFPYMKWPRFASCLIGDLGWVSAGWDPTTNEILVVLRDWSTSESIWEIRTGIQLPDLCGFHIGSEMLGDLDADGISEMGITVSLSGRNFTEKETSGEFFCAVLSGATGLFLDENE